MKNKKLFLHLAIIIIFSCIFTTVLIQSENPFFNDLGSKDAWINFFGSITGGLLTLYGVWWTIKDQEERRAKEYTLMNKPIICVDSIKSFRPFIKNNGYVDLSISIINKGKSEAKNLTFHVHIKDMIDDDYNALCQYNINMLLPMEKSNIKALCMRLPYNGVKGESIEIVSCYQDPLENYHTSHQIINYDIPDWYSQEHLDTDARSIKYSFGNFFIESKKSVFPVVHKQL